jgi:hypothetical protein
MSAQSVCASYLKEILQGIHQSSDTYKLALFTSAADLDHLTEVYDPTNDVVGTGYDAGGKTLTGFIVDSLGKTAWADFDTPVVWAASTITARYALIYNASQGDKAVVVLDFLVNKISTAGNFTVNLPDNTVGLVRITGP